MTASSLIVTKNSFINILKNLESANIFMGLSYFRVLKFFKSESLIINRYLGKEKITPKIVWVNVQDKIVVSENGCILFDDSVMDKRYSNKIELVRRQYSGNEHGVVKQRSSQRDYLP